jgi:hypothetical protein
VSIHTCAIREADLLLLRHEQRERERDFADLVSFSGDDPDDADVYLDDLTLE